MPKKATSALSLNSRWIILLSTTAAMLGSALTDSTGFAAIMTFDSVLGPISNGYGGLNWTNFNVLPATNNLYSGSGYQTVLTSSPNVGFNGNPALTSTISSTTPFTFLSGNFAAAWRDGLTVSVTAKSGTTTVGTVNFTLDTTTRSLETFNFGPVTELDFSSSGGTPHPGLIASEGEFAFDNLLVTGAGVVDGDPHFTTYDGVHYDYQGVGDFLLTRSTVAGDQFDVQVRTRPWYDGVGVTIVSEAAAELCNHRATFDLDRANAGGSFFWIDGQSTSLSTDHPVLTLDACKIVELSPNSYQAVWDTGEIVDVTNAGSYLNVASSLSPNDGPGSMEGLLSSNSDWRVTGAASLLDPVPEPGTLTLLATGLAALGIIRRRATSPKPH